MPRWIVEALESRDVPSGYHLGRLVQVSSTSLLADRYTNPDQFLLHMEDENQLAVDPTNPNHLVGLWHQDVSRDNTIVPGLVWGETFNGGMTWTNELLPGISQHTGGTLPGVGDPWVTFAPNGDLYAITLAYVSNGDFGTNVRSQVLVSKYNNVTREWGDPVVLSDDTDPRIFNEKESITADPADSRFVYAAWTPVKVPAGTTVRRSEPLDGFTGIKGPAQFSRSTDGGRTWEPARAIYDPGANDLTLDHQIVVRPDGILLDVFSETLVRNNDGGSTGLEVNLSLVWSPDRGQTWRPNGAAIRGPKMQGVLVFDPDNGRRVISDAGEGAFFDVAVDPHTGYLYAVWEDARFSGGQYNHIAFSQSLDGGLTWSAPIPVSQTPTGVAPANRTAFIPSVAVAADGTVAVSYYDFRYNDAAPGLPTDYWIVFGRPTTPTALTDPANWGAELRLTDHSFDLELTRPTGALWVGEYEGLSAVGNNFAALFSQSVSSTDPNSIFFRQVIAGSALQAASVGHSGAASTLTSQHVAALLPEAIHRWQAAGAETSLLQGIDVRIADLGGTTLGLASGTTIWLDDNAAGSGWFVDKSPWDDAEFTTPGDQGDQGRMDLLTVLMHELGHVLGHEHDADGLMAETLVAGTRLVPLADGHTDWLAAVDVSFLADGLFGTKHGQSW